MEKKDFCDEGFKIVEYVRDCCNSSLTVAKIRDALKGAKVTHKAKNSKLIERHKYYGIFKGYKKDIIEKPCSNKFSPPIKCVI